MTEHKMFVLPPHPDNCQVCAHKKRAGRLLDRDGAEHHGMPA